MRIWFAWAFLAACLLLGCQRAHACAPAEVAGATGQPLRSGTTAQGWYAYTFCPTDYSVGVWYAYGTWDAVLPAAVAEIHAAREGLAAFRAAVALNLPGRQCEIERDADGVQAMVEAEAWDTHRSLCFALRDAMAAQWPPQPVWQVVPPLSPATTRPVYPVVDGIRGSQPVYGVRATPEEKCACTPATAIPAGSPRNRWCPLEGGSKSHVTLCGRVQ